MHASVNLHGLYFFFRFTTFVFQRLLRCATQSLLPSVFFLLVVFTLLKLLPQYTSVLIFLAYVRTWIRHLSFAFWVLHFFPEYKYKYTSTEEYGWVYASLSPAYSPLWYCYYAGEFSCNFRQGKRTRVGA